MIFFLILSLTALASCERLSFLQQAQMFENNDFVITFPNIESESPGNGGTIQVQSLANNPVLELADMSITKFTLEPCAINLPHVHPRATEMIYVISGSNLRTGFVEENSGRVVINDISSDSSTFFPEGLMHYQQNLGCEPVEFVSMLNNADPGVQTITTQFFQFPKEALEGALGINNRKLTKIKSNLPLNIAQAKCKQECDMY
eukprot:Pgem_evm4s4769